MSNYEENDLCQECGVMDSVTTANDKDVCYRCAKKLRKNGRKPKERFTDTKEEEDSAYRQDRRIY